MPRRRRRVHSSSPRAPPSRSLSPKRIAKNGTGRAKTKFGDARAMRPHGSARLGSARLGSARLGSARIVRVRRWCVKPVCGALQALRLGVHPAAATHAQETAGSLVQQSPVPQRGPGPRRTRALSEMSEVAPLACSLVGLLFVRRFARFTGNCLSRDRKSGVNSKYNSLSTNVK